MDSAEVSAVSVGFNISVTTAATAGYPGYGLLPVYVLLAEHSRISRNALRDTKEPRRELNMLILISVLLACLALYSPLIFRNETRGVQCAPCAGLGALETCCFDADHARFNCRAGRKQCDLNQLYRPDTPDTFDRGMFSIVLILVIAGTIVISLGLTSDQNLSDTWHFNDNC